VESSEKCPLLFCAIEPPAVGAGVQSPTDVSAAKEFATQNKAKTAQHVPPHDLYLQDHMLAVHIRDDFARCVGFTVRWGGKG
jgi:hypothetical protein